jgi:large subunit ribosomal protein L18
MATKNTLRRTRIKRGIRNKISGTSEIPRLSIFRSNKSISAQLIDDINGVTLVGLSSGSKAFTDNEGTKTEVSKKLGKTIAEIAKSKGIEKVVFDRNGFRYHGRVQALADGAREGGLIF